MSERPTGRGQGNPTDRLDARVHGRVQGVGFRVHVRSAARRLGLVGWVANERDGGVRCVAEGPREDLERLVDVLRAGPPAAIVQRLDVSWLPGTGELGGFEVRSGWHPGD